MPLIGKKDSGKATRLFFATDVHGSERTYRKFLNAGKFYDAQVLVMGGDIIGKVAVPIIREGAGRYRATLQGTTESIESEEALQGLMERLGMLGFYAKIMTEEEFRSLSADPAASMPSSTRWPASAWRRGSNWPSRGLPGRASSAT
jgi:Icc-related predicted phosphoesterase